MTRGKAAKDKSAPKDGVRSVARNRKAYFDYEVVQDFEAGMVLTGSEVKGLREGKIQLADAYAVVERGEVFLLHMHIGEYAHGGAYNHVPTRSRKLLLHKREIERLEHKVAERGFTLIPLEVYFKDSRAKVKLGLCRGKAAYDKRASIRERDVRRDMARGEKDD